MRWISNRFHYYFVHWTLTAEITLSSLLGIFLFFDDDNNLTMKTRHAITQQPTVQNQNHNYPNQAKIVNFVNIYITIRFLLTFWLEMQILLDSAFFNCSKFNNDTTAGRCNSIINATINLQLVVIVYHTMIYDTWRLLDDWATQKRS